MDRQQSSFLQVELGQQQRRDPRLAALVNGAGQVPPLLLEELAQLQDQLPGFDSGLAMACIEEDLGAPVDEVFEQLDFLASENQVAVVSREEFTLKKNGQKVSFPKYIQVWTFDAAGKVEREFNSYDPTELLAAWRR